MSNISSVQPSERGLHAVTGAFEFSGRYIARRLLDEDHSVVCLTGTPDRSNPFNGQVAIRPFRFKNATAMAESLLQGVKVVYNTYWVRFNHPLFNYADAERNTQVLFEAAKMAGVERVVHVSITNADPNSRLEYFRRKG